MDGLQVVVVMARERDNAAQEFETMLRRHLAQGAGRTASCGGFDAERASAYIENALSDASRLRYETHLADCASCRRAVIELRRLMPEVEIIGATAPAPNRLAEWWDSVRQGFAAAPWRWGTLTAAGAFAMVLAFVIIPRQSDPIDRGESIIALATPGAVADTTADAATAFASTSDANAASDTASNTTQPQTAGASVSARLPASPIAARDSGRTSESTRSGAAAGSQAATVAAAADNQAAGPGRAGSLPGGTVAEVQPAPQSVRPATVTMMTPASPPAPDAPKNETARASDSAAENRAEEKGGAEEAAKAEQKAEQKNDAREDARNQPARRSGASAFVPRRRAGNTTPAPGAASSPGDDETVRPLTRKVRDKTFRYENGRWVDAEFKPEFLPPRTRLDRDTADFERVLTEHPELKPFFDLGRVIVVWQGKVYEVR